MITIHDDALSFVRSHPELFFRDSVPDPLVCAQCLLAEIMSLGAEEVSIRHVADWWLVTSQLDWFMGIGVDVLFKQLIPLPQLTKNTSRFEVVVAAYAAGVATKHRSQEPSVICGLAPSDDIWDLIPLSHIRALAFRFHSTEAT